MVGFMDGVAMNRIHFLFSVVDNYPHLLDDMTPENKRMAKKIIDVCPSCLKLKTCQKGCEKIREEVKHG
jgi:radical SAM protein with 4Fe4S-binding SPASM domain